LGLKGLLKVDMGLRDSVGHLDPKKFLGVILRSDGPTIVDMGLRDSVGFLDPMTFLVVSCGFAGTN
jgi:hypothetical protein